MLEQSKLVIEIIWIQSNILERRMFRIIEHPNGILVVPGFGKRGINGKTEAIKIAREYQTLFLVFA